MVDEMDAHPVHLGDTVIETVEPPLLPPPVEPVGPVRQQVTKVFKVSALRPRPPRRRIGPTRAPNALPQILENRIGHLDNERLDTHPKMIMTVVAGQRATGSAATARPLLQVTEMRVLRHPKTAGGTTHLTAL